MTVHRLVLILGCLAVAPGKASQEAELFWPSGERLRATWVGATPETVTVHPMAGDLFAESVDIRLQRLSHVGFNQADSKREEAFQFWFNDGSSLLADIRGLTPTHWQVTNAWLDEFEIQRTAIREIRRVRGPGILLAAPGPGVSLEEDPQPSSRVDPEPWLEDPFGDPFARPDPAPAKAGTPSLDRRSQTAYWTPDGGGMRTRTWNQTLILPLEEAGALPDRLRWDLELSAETPSPRFRLSWKSNNEALIEVETWDDQLVLRKGTQFRGVKLERVLWKGRMRLILVWDRRTGGVELLNLRGNRLVELPGSKTPTTPEEVPANQTRIEVQNLAHDLTLQSLLVTAWEGAQQLRSPPMRDHLRLRDGRVLGHRWETADQDHLQLRTEAGKTLRLPWDQIVALVRHLPRSDTADAVLPMLVDTQAGERIHARLLGGGEREDGDPVLNLRHPALGRVAARIRHLSGLHHSDPSQADATPDPELTDRIHLPGHSLRGILEAAGDPMPRWRFDGAELAVALNPRSSIETRIERLPRPGGDEGTRSLLHLRSGDLLPADLHSISTEAVGFQAPGVLRSTLAAVDLDAALFPGPALITEGFADPRWRASGNEEPIDWESPRLTPGVRIQHPLLCDSERLKLRIHPSDLGMSALRLSLRSDGVTSEDGPLRLIVAVTGDTLNAGEETGEGQFRRQLQAAYEGGPIDIHLRFDSDAVHVALNEQHRLKVLFPSSRQGNPTLALESTGIWGNPAQDLKLSGFSAELKPGRLSVPQLSEELMTQALTVPRQRSDDPPRHALIAPNGDVLRGVVTEWGAEELELRFGLETARIPRDRLAALVWLEAEDAETPTESDETAAAPDMTLPHWLELNSGGRIGMSLERWDDDSVRGHHPLLGTVRVEQSSIRRISLNKPPEPSSAMKAVRNWNLIAAADPDLGSTTQPGASDNSPLVGQTAANFELAGTGDQTWSLTSLRGKVVVLDFWATWCGPCLKAVPELVEAMSGLPPDKVQLLGVNQAENPNHVATFLQTRGWDFTTALDLDQSVSRKFGADSIPHTVIIDGSGTVVWVKTGYTPGAAEEVVEVIEGLLQE